MVCAAGFSRTGSPLLRPATVVHMSVNCRVRQSYRPAVAPLRNNLLAIDTNHDHAERRGLSSACSRASAVSTATALASVTYLQLFIATGDAHAAKVCFDVPDWVAGFDPKDAIFHSPVFAIGAAALALLLFPKLIKFSINYLAAPAIVCLLAWLAISYPQQTASSIYTVLEFIKEHPAASSIGVTTLAGVILGPDLLAGAAVAGVVLLLAVQAGVVQLPAVQLPRLPGQQLMAKQIGKAGKVIKQRIDDLDSPELVTTASSSGSSSWQQQQQESFEDTGLPYYNAASRSSNGRMQLAPPPLSMVIDSPAAAAAVHNAQQQQQQQQQYVPAAAADQATASSTLSSRAKALGSAVTNKLSQAGKGVINKVTSVITHDSDNRDDHEDDVSLRSRLSSRLNSTWNFSAQKVQQASQAVSSRVQQSEAVQGLGDMTKPSAAWALAKMKQGADAVQSRVLVTTAQQQQQQQDERVAAISAPGGSGRVGGLAAKEEQQQRSNTGSGDDVGRFVESILENS